MKVSIIGSRGIPASYGGFEIFAEHLSTRLRKKGHDITVCCEYTPSPHINSFKGVTLRYFPFPPPRNYSLRKLYELVNDLYFIYTFSNESCILYILGVGTAGWFVFFPKILNRDNKVISNIDGLEWKRGKFSYLEKVFLKLNNYLAVKFSDIVIVDSRSLKQHIPECFRYKAVFIPYGVEPSEKLDWNYNMLSQLAVKNSDILKIKRNNYWLVIARIEPENNIHTIMRGYLDSGSKKPLIIVGNSTSQKYEVELLELLSSKKGANIIFTGGIYNNNDLLNMLRQNCFGYIHGHSVGGTNPSLLESMACHNIILAHDNEFNREVCNQGALYFKDSVELGNKIRLIEANPNDYLELKNLAYDRVVNEYNWEKITSKYENLFCNLR